MEFSVKLLVEAVIGGLIVTLITGLISNTPAMLVGATLYGYPLPWLVRMVVSPEYNPWKIIPENLIADIIIWNIIVGIIIYAVFKLK